MAKKKVALVGFSESSRHLAPFYNEEFEIWGCNHLYRFIPRGDVWFEFHDHKELGAKYGDGWPEYEKWLKGQTMPIYMQEQYPEFPSSVRYPLEEILDKFAFTESAPANNNGARTEKPRCTVKSTLSYMLALAIHEDFKEIHIYGVDMILDSEWWFQRHNLYYFIGWAKGRGVKVVIPTESALLKEGACDLYAYQHGTSKYALLINKMREQDAHYKRRLDSLKNFNEGLVAKTQGIGGAIQELEELIKVPDFNGQKPHFEKRLAMYSQEFKKYNDKNEEVVKEIQSTDGARQNNFQWLERLGYNDRGEQMF